MISLETPILDFRRAMLKIPIQTFPGEDVIDFDVVSTGLVDFEVELGEVEWISADADDGISDVEVVI